MAHENLTQNEKKKKKKKVLGGELKTMRLSIKVYL